MQSKARHVTQVKSVRFAAAVEKDMEMSSLSMTRVMHTVHKLGDARRETVTGVGLREDGVSVRCMNEVQISLSPLERTKGSLRSPEGWTGIGRLGK